MKKEKKKERRGLDGLGEVEGVETALVDPRAGQPAHEGGEVDDQQTTLDVGVQETSPEVAGMGLVEIDADDDEVKHQDHKEGHRPSDQRLTRLRGR